MEKKTGAKTNGITEFWIFGLVALSFIIAVAKGFALELSDQNIYFYMGKMIAEGNLPYREFFFSHPPGEIYIDALVYKVFGFKLLAFKVVSLVAVIASSYLLFLLLKENFGRVEALVSSAIFLYTYETIRIAAGNIGMAITVLLSVLAVYFAVNRKMLLSGIFIGLAGLMTFHAFPIFAALTAYSLISIENSAEKSKLRLKPKSFGFFLLGFAIAFGLPTLIMLFVVGQQYYLQVVKYHLLKPAAAVAGVKFGLFKLMLKYNLLVFLPVLLAFTNFMKGARKEARSSKGNDNESKKPPVKLVLYPVKSVLYLAWLSIAIYIVYLALLNRVFPYYYFILFPFLALISSISIVGVTRKISSKNKGILLGAVGILIIVNLILSAKQFYWTVENAHLDGTLEGLSSEIPAGNAVFGDYLFAPLVALQNGNTVALNMVDTNPFRFQTGSVSYKELSMNLEDYTQGYAKAGRALYMILRQSNDFMLKSNATKDYINRNCKIARTIDLTLPSYFSRQIVNDKLFVLKCG